MRTGRYMQLKYEKHEIIEGISVYFISANAVLELQITSYKVLLFISL